ncbi:MAG: efflux RND transporter periplasmic adaptor subunit [Verrucomicrobiota bacterium]
MPRKKSKWRRRLILIAILLLGLGGWFWWKKKQDEVKPILIETEKVILRDVIESVVATGNIQPVTKVMISPEVAGEIVEIPVVEGQVVKEGDLLVRIRPDNYLALLDSAEANYQSTLSNLKLSRANLEKAKADFERTKGLYQNKLISEAEYLGGKTSYEVAEASFENAEHGVSRGKAALEQANEDLAKTSIRAPIPGTIVQLKSEKGERVAGTSLMAGTEMMTVAQLESMEARVEVGEIDVVAIKIGQKARLEVDAFREEEFAGTVTEIANGTNAAASGGAGQSATKFQVKIRIDDKAAFRPGMSVTSYIETKSVAGVPTVPIQSVTTRARKAKEEEPGKEKEKKTVDEDGEAARKRRKQEKKKRVQEVVFVLDGDRVKQVEVERGISDDDFVEIKSGLNEGEVVVTGSFKAINRELKEGALIKLKGEGDPDDEEKK